MDKNTKTLVSVLGVVAVMIGLAFASVPLYNVFCRVTGYGGTTQVSELAPSEDQILDRDITIHFNSDTNRNIKWDFKPDKRQITIKVGQQGFMSFRTKNNDNKAVTGTAVYNVTPSKAGEYFHKTQCFCFDRQTLKPGEEVEMPVVFYVDPSIAEDRNMDDVSTITLSYSFFKADSKELDSAIEAFYNDE
ncbi:MAG TPA: cytochrome c oxidase assembly protein [Alphaproteobacteria bacterium]|nr:cytochrome c oxidase assembly protein [Alphaproteobacteria bacterium]